MDKSNSRLNQKNALMGLKYLHLIITVGIFVVFWIQFRYHGQLPHWERAIRYDLFIAIGYGFISYYFIKTYNAYKVGHFRIRDLAFSQTLSNIISICVVYLGTAIAWWQWHNPMVFLIMLLIQWAVNVAWSYFANLIYSKRYPPLDAIIVYKTDVDLKRIECLKGKPTDRTFSISGKYRCNEDCSQEALNNLFNAIEDYDAVFVAGIDSWARNAVAKKCVETEKFGYFVPHIGDLILEGGSHVQSFSSPIVGVNRKVPRREYLLIKRFFDIFASLCGLIVLSPLLLCVAIIIKIEDHGPVFYKQERLTTDGKTFKLIKFRSMKVDAESDGVARLSSGENDDRITKIGRFIRKCRIDELPQLINIISGDMTIVGPRPERPEIAKQYAEELPDFELRLQVTAGLTGYAQIYGKYNTSPYEKLEFDLMYINDMNVLTDLQLMFATVRILFSKESTEGVEDGQMNAMDCGISADSTNKQLKRLKK